MRILFGEDARDYKNYEKDREKFLRNERSNLRKEEEKVREKLNAFCKDGKHIFIVNRDEYGELVKTCSKCPMTIRISRKDY